MHAIDFFERPGQGGSQAHRSSMTRRETLAWLMLSIMQQGTISLWRLATYVASAAQIASVQRSYRFDFVQLGAAHAAHVMVELPSLSGKP
jgi:hypothetical protein